MAKTITTGRPKLRHRVLARLESAAQPVEPVPAGTRTGSWRWLFVDPAGVRIAGPPVCFSSAEVAEIWLGTARDALACLGISAVTLLDGEHVVYGPTALPPAASG